jgi:hypothetical protein
VTSKTFSLSPTGVSISATGRADAETMGSSSRE